MIYIHDSPVRSHGNLTTNHCLVDSRWVVKIADFGLHQLKQPKPGSLPATDGETMINSLGKCIF